MIKLKFVTLAGLMMGLWASGASAETVRCEGNHPANVPAPFTLEFHQQNASDPLNPPWNDSKLTLYHASGDRVVTWRVGPYVRTKRANQLVYFNQSSVNSSGIKNDLLVINSTVISGEQLSGEYTLTPNISKGKVTCSITGDPMPPVPACPDKNAVTVLLIDEAKRPVPSAIRIEELLECGAEANAKDQRGCTALQYLADLDCGLAPQAPGAGIHPGAPDAPEVPMAPGYARSGTLIVEKNMTDSMNTLLDHGAQIDSRDPVNKQTPLMKVVRFNQASGISLLLGLEANVNAQDIDGNSPLILAASVGSYWTVDALLQAGPNLSIKNKAGKTAFQVAKELGRREIMELLEPVEATVILEGKADGGCSPTMVHLNRGKPVQILLKASPNKMYLLQAPALGLELMAAPNSTVKKTITPPKTGNFPFTCGVHGAPEQTKGTFMVM